MSTPHYFQIVVAGLMLMNVALKADAPAVPGFEQARLAAVPERMRQFVREKQIAGSVTLVATRDRFVQLDAVGQADIGSGAPMKVDSIFWIASMTKPITAAAVLMLQDEGKLSIDDLAAKYLPELAELKGPGGRPAKVTLKQMRTHTSGMVPEAPNRVLRNAKSLADLVPVVTWWLWFAGYAAATTWAVKLSTSRISSTARWVATRCWTVATNASSTPSRWSYVASGTMRLPTIPRYALVQWRWASGKRSNSTRSRSSRGKKRRNIASVQRREPDRFR